MRFLAVRRSLIVVAFAASSTAIAAPQQLSQQVRTAYVKVDAPLVALTHARMIDGSGGPVRQNQTLVVKDGVIAAVGDPGSTPVPAGAEVIDLTGKTVLPGLVMVH